MKRPLWPAPALLPSLLLASLFLAGAPALPAAAEEAPAPTAPESSAEAIALLERAAKAIGEVHAVRYTAKTRPGGVGERFWPATEGTAVYVGWDATLRRPAKFHLHLDTRAAGAEESVEITGGGDGERFFVVDHGTRKGYEDIDPLVFGSHEQTFRRFEVAEFVSDDPFRDEIQARSVELLGTRELDGHECYEIHVKYSGGRGEATWLLSTEDLLPRYRIQSFSIPQGEGFLEITLTELEVDPEVSPELFEMDLPEGYERVDDFAP